MDLGLSGKVALVTGGSSGLGLGCAAQLLDEGARVMITARSDRALDAADRLARTHGDRVRGVAADLSDAAAMADVLERTTTEWGALDAVVISGGGPPSSAYLETTDDAWREAFEQVFLGPVRLAREASDRMSPGGCIGFILSNSVYAPIAGLALSNGLRPGIAMAAKSLSDELGPRGIRVVGLVPGRIATERTVAVDSAAPEVSKRRNAAIPLGRLGTVEEFARVATFAVSPAASYMTGTCIVVDGGAQRSL